MTLTEFLLARIAEDEERADTCHDMSVDSFGDLEQFGDCYCGLPARVLAECTAKRSIIEWAERWIDMDPNCSPIDCDSYQANTVLRLLACTFVDHVDYQDEWRP